MLLYASSKKIKCLVQKYDKWRASANDVSKSNKKLWWAQEIKGIPILKIIFWIEIIAYDKRCLISNSVSCK